MPILHGDQLIGRVDPALDRNHGRLTINSVHAESGASASAGAAVARAIESLAEFLGAGVVDYTGPVPSPWKRAFLA